MVNPLRHIAIAAGFLTRIPIRTGAVRDAELAASLAYFPIVGIGIGVAAAAVALWLTGLGWPMFTAVGVVVVYAFLSGGLHLDGVADVFDALGGGRGDRARMLEIMKDSRIGAHGAVALFLVILAKFALLVPVVARGHYEALIVAPMAARWATVPLILFYPYARDDGLGRAFKAHAGPRQLVVASLLTAAAVFVIDPGLAWPTVVALSVANLFAGLLSRRLGGLTGDCYGAAIEIAEVAFLFKLL